MPTSLAPQRPRIPTRMSACAVRSFTAKRKIPTPLPPLQYFSFPQKACTKRPLSFRTVFAFQVSTGSARRPFRWSAAPAPAA
jgi:hypothetical protein